MAYFSTKRFGPISTGHRQWKDTGHCSRIHGYGRTVKIVFSATTLDDKLWVVDFGGLKDFRKWLEEQWDHNVLVASDDPKLNILKQMEQEGLVKLNIMDVKKGHGPGIEGSCKHLFDYLNPIIEKHSGGRCWVHSIEIWEHENNSAIYETYKSTFKR
ncbi:QueD-like 6-pyruvoyl-tetrahydropterin synthase [Pseudomonas phage Cassandra]|nr:QueD-like 6-pyruvoyl-tetrahydropterin synthase [Pseudomonas phage Cassandra]